jgi:predicted aconitase
VLRVHVELTKHDKQLLEGQEGKAKQTAMKVVLRIADIQGAKKLININRAHIDGCIYTGPASLHFAETLAELGGKVSVPTSMNAISIDRSRWREQGVDPEWARSANRLAEAYLKMGAQPTFSCAPYQFPERPRFGEHIGWAESNAVVYANSVLGARTNRYGDLMDICVALIGRAPLSGYHLDENRKGTILIELPELGRIDSSFYPTFGYLVGSHIGSGVPVITGLKHQPTLDDLKAFGAAIATAGSVGMFHIVGVTPEAATVEEAFGYKQPIELADVWKKLSSAKGDKVDQITIGSPHFSLEECKRLARLVKKQQCKSGVEFLITTSQYVYEEAKKAGITNIIERFGAKFATDTCLCMVNTPVILEKSQTLMTNSAKYAHYAPGLVGRNIYFGSLEDCVNSAITGETKITTPAWFHV